MCLPKEFRCDVCRHCTNSVYPIKSDSIHKQGLREGLLMASEGVSWLCQSWQLQLGGQETLVNSPGWFPTSPQCPLAPIPNITPNLLSLHRKRPCLWGLNQTQPGVKDFEHFLLKVVWSDEWAQWTEWKKGKGSPHYKKKQQSFFFFFFRGEDVGKKLKTMTCYKLPSQQHPSKQNDI